MNIALDIIAVAIVAASVLLGIKKGFLKTVLALAGMILVFFLAYKLSVPLGNVIDEKIVNPSLRGTASSRIADKIGVELQEGDKEAQLENFEAEIEQKNESEEGLTVLGIGREKINQAAQEASGSVVKGIFSLVDKLSGSVSRIIAAVAIILAGVLILFVLKLVIRPILKAVHLGGFDSALGGVLGGARGVLIVLLLAFVLRLALPAISNTINRETIDKTLVFKYAYSLVDGE
ncbi:MAG: CvpA family protein [Clostridia bacterium]|nr:CvpA family protein [Clostridia bacterium]